MMNILAASLMSDTAELCTMRVEATADGHDADALHGASDAADRLLVSLELAGRALSHGYPLAKRVVAELRATFTGEQLTAIGRASSSANVVRATSFLLSG